MQQEVSCAINLPLEELWPSPSMIALSISYINLGILGWFHSRVWHANMLTSVNIYTVQNMQSSLDILLTVIFLKSF